MSHNSYLRSGGVWNPGVVLSSEFAAFDRAQFKSINGDDGGAWAPSTQIQIGGAGAWFFGELDAGNASGSPTFVVTGQAARLQNAATLTVLDTSKISAPGAGIVVNDGNTIKYSPARTFSNVPAPHTMLPSSAWVAGSGGNLGPQGIELGYIFPTNSSASTDALVAHLQIAAGTFLTSLRVSVRASATAPAVTNYLKLTLYYVPFGASSSSASPIQAAFDSTPASSYTTQHTVTMDLTPLSGGGLTIAASTAYWLVYSLGNGSAGCVMSLGPPFMSGSISELRTY